MLKADGLVRYAGDLADAIRQGAEATTGTGPQLDNSSWLGRTSVSMCVIIGVYSVASRADFESGSCERENQS